MIVTETICCMCGSELQQLLDECTYCPHCDTTKQCKENSARGRCKQCANAQGYEGVGSR